MSPRKAKNKLRSQEPKTVNSLLQPASGSGSRNDLYPKFSLEHLQTKSKYCLSCCSKDQKAAFANKLKELSELQWKQIINSPKHGNGYEIIKENSLKIDIPARVKKFAKTIVAFRFHAKHPMVGFIEHDTFYILWFDHDFTLYKHS
jgi:hypothetical protein